MPTNNIEKLKEVFQSTKGLRFDGEPAIDLRDRLDLLTVVAGLREVAAFGFGESGNEGDLRNVKDRFGNYGLLCQITGQIRHEPHGGAKNIPRELVEVFDGVDAESYRRNSGRLLWVYRRKEIRDQIKRAVNRELASGTLLGYPQCCVERHRVGLVRHQEAFSQAIIGAVGKDSKAVERALREDLEVSMPADVLDDRNIQSTDERFPFVHHIACDNCLASETSPSGQLNAAYENLAREISSAFHRAIREMSVLESKLLAIADAAEKRGLTPDTLEREAKEQFEQLLRDRRRIHAEAFM